MRRRGPRQARSQTKRESGASAGPEIAGAVEKLRALVTGLEAATREALEARLETAQANTRYRLLFDLVPSACLVTDVNGLILEVNDAAAEYFGVQAQRLLRKPLAVFVPEDKRRDFRSRLHELAEAGRTDAWPLRLQTRNRSGSAIASVSADREDPNAELRLRWAIRDITELERALLATRESEERRRLIFESSPDATAVNLLDEGTYIEVSHEFERLSGYSREVIVGRTPRDLGFWSEKEELAEFMKDLRTLGAVRNMPVHLQMQGGRAILGLMSAAIIEVDKRRCVISFTRDVTENQRALDELQRLREENQERSRLAELGALVTSLVHDFGNPIAAILLHLEVIRRSLKEVEDRRIRQVLSPLEEIAAQARRLEQMSAAFRDFSRRRHLDIAPVEGAGLVRSLARSWRAIARRQRVSVSVRAPEGLPMIAVDETQIARVLDNLVRNAIEAHPGTVAVELSAQTAGQVRVSVRDDGEGIAEGFDPFALFQTTKPQGTGLGLAISREIVQAHGGKLSFERLPRGTVFHLDLAAANSAAVKPSSPTLVVLGKKRA